MLDDLLTQSKKSNEPDLLIPDMAEQKRIVTELKRLEESGELTPEILEEFLTGKRTKAQD